MTDLEKAIWKLNKLENTHCATCMGHLNESVREIKSLLQKERSQTKKADTLEKVVIDIQWMAKRYVDGRRTYAVAMYNDAIKKAIDMGLHFREDCDGEIFAKDGDEFANEDHSEYLEKNYKNSKEK